MCVRVVFRVLSESCLNLNSFQEMEGKSCRSLMNKQKDDNDTFRQSRRGSDITDHMINTSTRVDGTQVWDESHQDVVHHRPMDASCLQTLQELLDRGSLPFTALPLDQTGQNRSVNTEGVIGAAPKHVLCRQS